MASLLSIYQAGQYTQAQLSQQMDCHKLVYKSFRSQTPYDNFIRKLREREEEDRKRIIYGRVLKFQESRYPKELLDMLEAEINPFQLSLQKLKEHMTAKYPEYSADIIGESVEYIFYRKYEQSDIIKESVTVIEDGSEYIRNGRKLMKEDFSYQYKNRQMNNPPLSASRYPDSSRLSNFMGKTDRDRGLSPEFSRRGDFSPAITAKDPYKSYSKEAEVTIMNERFNSMLSKQIRQEGMQYENIELIFEQDPNDLINHPDIRMKESEGGYTGRSQLEGLTGRSESFPKFKEDDVIHNLEGGMDTGRSDLQQLQLLLSIAVVAMQDDRMETNRSRKSSYPLKISKENMENLYTIDGNLKLDLVKRVIGKLKKERM